MTTLLSADDLNDFISPGLACVMPPVPAKEPDQAEAGQVEIQIDSRGKPLEVSEIDSKYQQLAPAQILLADCLACSGCITLAEEVLVAQHSHTQVIKALNDPQKLYVASISHQARASLAVAYDVSVAEMDIRLCVALRQLDFTYVVGLDLGRKLSLMQEASSVISQKNVSGGTGTHPLLLSICPGWVLYAEKTHPEMIQYLSPTKSPQQITGCLLKLLALDITGTARKDIYHVSIMPCFDKKLESARPEADQESTGPSPDVDCVLSAKETVALFDELNISLGTPVLPVTLIKCLKAPASSSKSLEIPIHSGISYSDHLISNDKNASVHMSKDVHALESNTPSQNAHESNPSLNDVYRSLAPPNWPCPELSWANDTGLGLGGYAYTYLKMLEQEMRAAMPQEDYHIETVTGRNADICEMKLLAGTRVVGRAGVVNGFRNIQNLVRKLKNPGAKGINPLVARRRIRKARSETDPKASEEAVEVHTCDYVEVMACPGGCINGGGQINALEKGIENERQWVDRVLEAYYLIPVVDVSAPQTSRELLQWMDNFTHESGVPRARLMNTHFTKVEKPTDPNAVLLGAKW